MNWRTRERSARQARRADATNVAPGVLRDRQRAIAYLTAKDSALEKRFLWTWQAIQGPALVREHRFDAVRKWRFDFAHIGARVAVEVEGGTWGASCRHSTGLGFRNDCEKYNAAALAGWTVFRLTEDMLKLEVISEVHRFIITRLDTPRSAPTSESPSSGVGDASPKTRSSSPKTLPHP